MTSKESSRCQLQLLLNAGSREKCGLAFGEAVLMSSPPSRSQMCAGANRQDFAESGFGGWADENSPRCGSHVESKRKSIHNI